MKKLGRNAVIAVVVLAMSLMLFTACGGKNEKDAFAVFAGEWAADISSYNGIVIHEDGSWQLYKNGGLYSSGELDYHSDDDSVWISPDNNTQWSRLYIEEDGSLYAAPIGYFLLGDISLEYIPEADEEWEEDTGDDWRDSGVVVDSGFLTREDIGEVYVLVTVDEESVSFYLDEQEQILLDCLFFPLTVPNAQDNYFGISFDDKDGDGESDVSLSFYTPEGEGSLLVWFWDPQEGYVFQSDWSVLPMDNADPDDYIYVNFDGFWEYPDGTVLEIENDMWYLYDADEFVIVAWGPLEYEGEAAYLMNDDGSSGGGCIYIDEDGDLVDSSGDVLTYLGMSIEG